jgi:hypothetical protein
MKSSLVQAFLKTWCNALVLLKFMAKAIFSRSPGVR